MQKIKNYKIIEKLTEIAVDISRANETILDLTESVNVQAVKLRGLVGVNGV